MTSSLESSVVMNSDVTEFINSEKQSGMRLHRCSNVAQMVLENNAEAMCLSREGFFVTLVYFLRPEGSPLLSRKLPRGSKTPPCSCSANGGRAARRFLRRIEHELAYTGCDVSE